MQRKHFALLTAAVVATLGTSARGEISFFWTLIDTGAPKAPTYVHSSGLMQGYSGYILQLTCVGDVVSGYDLGAGGPGEIRGNFSQVWTASEFNALVDGVGYDTSSPGLTFFKNESTSIWNADSHLLGDVAKTLSSVAEDGFFLTNPGNVNPYVNKSNDVQGLGSGTWLGGEVSWIGGFRAATVDVAYLVVPTGSAITIVNAHVAPNTLGSSQLLSFPTPNAYSHWNTNGGGSWNDASTWSAGAKIRGSGGGVTGGVPQRMGDVAQFSEQVTSAITVTLDGDKTISHMTIGTKGAFTLAQGTGGKLTFDNDDFRSDLYMTENQPRTISVPVDLKSKLGISTESSLKLEGPITGNSSSPLEVQFGRVILTGANSYEGATLIAGTLQIGDGGTSGTFGAGEVVFVPQGGTPGELIFNRSDSYTVTNGISGKGNITKMGDGTVTLSGLTTYNGTTTILGGALVRLNAGPASDTPAVVLGPNSHYTNWVTPQGTLAGYRATSAVGGTQAALRAGLAGAQTEITMSFRTRSVTDPVVLASDILELTGMAQAGNPKTPAFALELSYDQALVASEALKAAQGNLHLVWLNDDLDWVNAVVGNHDEGFTVIENFQGSWTQFANSFSVTDGNLGLYMGSWGVDIAGNTVWAVLDHNSSFSVTSAAAVPEPASLSVLVVSAGFLLARRRRGV